MSEILNKPIQLPVSGKYAQTRFLKSAMTERLCSWDEKDIASRGKPTPEYIRLYEEWGKGKFGVIVLGNLPVDARHPEAAKNACVDRDSNWDVVEAFKPVVKASKADGALLIGQLTHAGRQCSKEIQPEPVSASDVQCAPAMGMEFNKPRPLTLEEVHDVIDRFAWSAKALYDAGADGAQLHAAHGYLLNQFLSPRTNLREDDFGGSFDKRSRIVFDIIKKIRERVPDERFIISIKINSNDFAEGAWTSEDMKTMAQRLEEAGVDLIELSGGTYESMAFEHKKESTKRREAFFIEFAEEIRPVLKRSVLAVTGGFRSRDKMAQAINEGSCHMVGVARPVTAEPTLPRDVVEGRSEGAKTSYIKQQLSTPASIKQLQEIGHGKPLSDYSNKDVAEKTNKEIGG